MSTILLQHNKVLLALHELTNGDGLPLLLLHGLGEQSPTSVPSWATAWPGPVHALDFTGHGASTVPWGGGYSAETLLADADIALAHLGELAVAGRGVGAYVALMLAGARPQHVRGAVLCDGPGLSGGATGPTSSSFVTIDPPYGAPDPNALIDLSRDLRPPDYARLFARLAVEHSGIADPVSVAAVVRPPWLAAVIEEVGVVERSIVAALTGYAG